MNGTFMFLCTFLGYFNLSSPIQTLFFLNIMHLTNSKTPLILHFVSVCAVIIFLLGFFPHNIGKVENTSAKPRDDFVRKKLVLLVIDAMRVDFLTPNEKYSMPFLHNTISRNESCFLTVKAAAPTVTLPRIKAMTSGQVPNFVDILFNFDSDEFNEDTFLNQAIKFGLQPVFYGDDTWLKMFPNTFVRSVGVHSFFAADFWEVDQNITKQLEVELNRSDWDILILHYLGLDHIGHMEGPSSSNIAPKLIEMDNIVKKINNSIFSKDSNAIFIVTSDHGMKDSGGHGGVTDAEIKVPLVSVNKKCRHFPGWPDPWEYSAPQIDLASTISVELNIPIPSQSIGKIIPTILTDTDDITILKTLQMQRNNLQSIYATFPPREEEELKLESETDREFLFSKYFKELSVLTDDVMRLKTEMKLSNLILGTFILVINLFIFILIYRIPFPSQTMPFTLCFGTVFHTISFASTSFIEEEHQTWYFFMASILVLSLREELRKSFEERRKYRFKHIFSAVFLCVLHRILRKLNQTGDKWSNLPDLEDFLRSHHFMLLLTLIIGFAPMIFLYMIEIPSRLPRLLFAANILSILAHKLATRTFDHSFIMFYPKSRGITEAHVFLFVFVMYCILSIKKGLSFSWNWSLLCLLTHRPHNVVLIPALIMASKYLHLTFSTRYDIIWNCLSHAWIGSVFYFYQGNSNSLANVDVAAGFIGTEAYNAAYAGLLIAVNTFSAPILSFLLSKQIYYPLILVRLLPLTFYCITLIFQRHHLFIWSVLSPKLFLDSAFYIVLFLFFLCHYSHQKITLFTKTI